MKGFGTYIPPAFLESKLAIGLFAGVFLALVIFFSSSPQFGLNSANDLFTDSLGNGSSGPPVKEKNDLAPAPDLLPGNGSSSGSPVKEKNDTAPAPDKLITESPPAVTKQADDAKEPTTAGEGIAPRSQTAVARLKPICDFSDQRYDLCEMWGDARTTSGTNRSRVYFVPPAPQLAAAEAASWSVRSQSRKYVGVREVLVRSLNLSDLQDAPNCTVRRDVPAVVFAVGALTFNYWHAFSDVLVPLFTTARAFGGEVELLATDTAGRGWFLGKYRRILEALSRYEAVDLDADTEVRCYPHLVVGLRGHRDFDIDPERAPNRYDMLAFRLFVREAYGLPPPAAAPLPCLSSSDGAKKKPRAMIILRGRTRRYVNPDAVVDAVERAGFDVVRMEPGSSAGSEVDEVARQVDACDVLIGAHGAGLTNMLFLRTGAVVVQVVPWGKMEPHSQGYFGAPAEHMGVRHVMYSIAPEESTLYERYGKDSQVITDPDAFYRNGTNAKYYWWEQDIRLNTTRFMPTLEMVKRMLLQE